MPATNTDSATNKLAVVTGAIKGVGFEICRQLATVGGIIVVLTARDENKGVETAEKLKGSELSDVVFRQLDVIDPASTTSLAKFIKTWFGKLDILVNNTGIGGHTLDDDAVRAVMAFDGPYVTDTWTKEVLSDEDGLTEEKVDDVLNKYLKNSKDTHGRPAYKMSKAAMNAYTRILAKKFPKFCINCLYPGWVKTDIDYNIGVFTAEEGAVGPVKLALLPDDGPSGLFFYQTEVSMF